MRKDFQIEEIMGRRGLPELAPEWDALFEACPEAAPFQSPQWLIPWSAHLGAGEPYVLALRSGGALSAIAAFMLTGPELVFMGTGVSDYLDMLARPGLERAAALAVMERLGARQELWARCDLQELKAGSALLSITMPPGIRAKVRQMEPCLHIELPATLEEFAARCWTNRQTGSSRTRARHERSGLLTIETADGERLGEFIDSLFTLHAKRWASLGLPGVLNGRAIRSFHTEAAKGLLEKGMLRLYRMRYSGSDIAALYCLFRSGRVYAYLGGFDPALSRLSPGAQLLRHVVEDSIRTGAGVIDFLRGGEGYKYAWRPKEERNFRLVIERA
ncbi:MAG TPA: GNAT family N-acetyltransferase [Thermodesulfobacteriota bacterium]